MFYQTNIRENKFYFELIKVHVLYGNRCSLLILKCCYTIKKIPPPRKKLPTLPSLMSIHDKQRLCQFVQLFIWTRFQMRCSTHDIS